MNDVITSQPHLIFRCDSSPEMGTGHVMRCLTMANVWRHDFGGTAIFCCAQLSGSLEERIQNGGHSIVWLGENHDFANSGDALLKLCMLEDASAIMIDGYHFDRSYRAPLKSAPIKVATMRDACSETYGADMVIDSSPIATPPTNTDRHETIYALGPEYALVAPSILTAKELPVEPQGILISFGGSDPHGFSMPVAKAIRSHLPSVPIHVVLGGSVADSDAIALALAKIPYITVSQDLPSLGPAIVGAQMVVTAAGSSLYEIAALARPMVLFITEDNQTALGALNWAKVIDVRSTPHAVKIMTEAALELFRDEAEMARMSERAAQIIDGKGAHRVLSLLKALVEP